jgi:hypothetical protein
MIRVKFIFFTIYPETTPKRRHTLEVNLLAFDHETFQREWRGDEKSEEI